MTGSILFELAPLEYLSISLVMVTFFLRVSHKFGPTDPFGHVAVSIVSFVLTVSCKWCGTVRGARERTQGHATLEAQVGPGSTPPCVPNLDVCYHLSVYGSRDQTNNHSEEPR